LLINKEHQDLSIHKEHDVVLGDMHPLEDTGHNEDLGVDDRDSERSHSVTIELTSRDIVRSYNLEVSISKVIEDAGLEFMDKEYMRYYKECDRALCTPYGQQPHMIWFPQQFR
jgi:hypothetical protein